MAEELREKEAASQTERYGEHHRERQDVRLVLCRQDQIDEDEAQQEDNRGRVGSLGFLTSQALIVVSISRRQHIGSHFLHSLDSLTGRVAVGHRSRHRDRGEQVEAVDVRRAIDTLHVTVLLDRSHARRRAYIYTIKRLKRLARLWQTLDHHTVELTVGIEVRSIETAIVTLQRGEYRRGRDAALLTLGHIDRHHVLRIVRVVGRLCRLDLRALVELCQVILHDTEELGQVATRTVLHHKRDTRVGREARNHRRCESQDLGILDMSRLDEDLGDDTCGFIRIEEETVDTVALPQSAEFPPESLLTVGERLQLDDERSLVGTRTSDEVVTLNLLTALDGWVSSEDRIDLTDNLTRTSHRCCRRHRDGTEDSTRILIRHQS